MNDSERPDLGDLVAAVSSGDRRTALEAIRDRLAADLMSASSGVTAQIAAQLRATLKEIAELPDSKKLTKADELANRRRARIAAAQSSASAAGEGL